MISQGLATKSTISFSLAKISANSKCTRFLVLLIGFGSRAKFDVTAMVARKWQLLFSSLSFESGFWNRDLTGFNSSGFELRLYLWIQILDVHLKLELVGEWLLLSFLFGSCRPLRGLLVKSAAFSNFQRETEQTHSWVEHKSANVNLPLVIVCTSCHDYELHQHEEL